MTGHVDSATNAGQPQKSWLQRLCDPCDVAGVALFRVFFAGAVLAHVWLYFSNDSIEYFFGSTPHHLTYFGFEWVQALELDGMRRIYYLMALSAVGVAFGLLYRISAVILFVTFTYTFLADAGQFQNHFYLMSLISFLLILIPAHRSFSVDSVLVPDKASGFIPNWCRVLLMFQIGIPYVFGGIAKLNNDWLHGMPVGIWISAKSDLPIIGPLLTERWIHWFISYAGLVIDLSCVPLLLWKRTRIPAVCVLTVFHLTNSVLFEIDVFPWMSILSLAIFFPPNWPRRVLRLPGPQPPPSVGHEPCGLRQRCILGLIGIYVCWQVLFPLRHLLYPGNPSWTEEGQQFAWRMMLRTKNLFIRVYATDGPSRQTVEVPVSELMNRRQIGEFAQSPDHIVATAQFFAELARAIGLSEVEIRTVAIVSLNGRKPQLLIDPHLDLLTVRRSIGPQSGIVALAEPLRENVWNAPSDDWPEMLGIRLPPTVAPPQQLPGARSD